MGFECNLVIYSFIHSFYLIIMVSLTELEKNIDPTTCLVTGGASFVGSHVVSRLLQAGHIVKATARSKNKLETCLGHLLEDAPETARLEFIEADLTQRGLFDDAVKGCTHVFHLASPFILNIKGSEAEEKIVKPAVEGVENVLSAVLNTPSVKKVVMTSSIVAMCGDNVEHKKDPSDTVGYVGEDDWNSVSTLWKGAYNYSKTLAEKKAWEMAKDASFELICVNPGFVLGPPLCKGSGESIMFAEQCLSGKFRSGFPPLYLSAVDVRDVAAAHTVAAFSASAHGRYLCAAGVRNMHHLLRDVGQKFSPEKKLVGPMTPVWLVWILSNVFRMLPWEALSPGLNKPMELGNERIQKDLGVNFIPPEQSLYDMLVCMEAWD